MITACMAANRQQALETVLLVHSLRTWGGDLGRGPFWVLTPPGSEFDTPRWRAALADHDAAVHPFELSAEAAAFPLADKVYAAAQAETLAAEQNATLAWLDSDTLILAPPAEFQLGGETRLAYRPVHHKLIGSDFDAEPDAFWRTIYDLCAVPAERVFPMTSVVDGCRIRPYINAGSLAVDPGAGTLRAWRDRFDAVYRSDALKPFYRQQSLYAVFAHQAVLSAVMLARLPRVALHELSPRINYPIHMHDQHPAADRPARIDELVTARYDMLIRAEEWPAGLPASADLCAWLATATEAAKEAVE